MAGGNPPKPPSNKPPNPPPSSSHRSNKSRWESSSASASAATPPSNKKPSSSDTNKPKPTANKPKPPTPKPKANSYSNKPSPKPTNPSPRHGPNHSKLPPFPFPDPPPPPAYGFHMLDRRTVVLADGSVRSYFALPPDYQNFTPMPPRPGFGFDRKYPISPEFRGPEFRPELGERGDGLMRGRSQDYRNAVGFEGRGSGPGMGEGPRNWMKRKLGDEERERRDGFERQRQQLLQYGNVDENFNGMPGPSGVLMGRGGEEMRAKKFMRIGESNVGGLKHNEVDQAALKKAFLHFVKLIYENANQKRKYLADGKQGSLQCIACGRFAIRVTLLFSVSRLLLLLLLLLLTVNNWF